MSTEAVAGPSVDKPSTSNESNKPSEIELRILAMGQDYPSGFSNDILDADISDVPPDQRAAAINELLRKGLINIFMQGKVLMYKVNSGPAKAIKGDDNEERVVYEIIRDSGNKGVWIKDIRAKSNLLANQLNKVLKSMESKKMVKSINSATANKRKVYILYDVEPDVSLTGGAWYGKDDFEAEFVDILNKQAKKYLEEKWTNAKENSDADPVMVKNLASASVKDVLGHIQSLGISNVKLCEQDIDSLLNTIVLDGCAERHVLFDGSVVYRYVPPLLGPAGLILNPCGICPVLEKCSTTGRINPVECHYLNEWLPE